MEPDYCLWGHHTSNYAMKSFACMIHGGSFAFNLCPIGGMGNIDDGLPHSLNFGLFGYLFSTILATSQAHKGNRKIMFLREFEGSWNVCRIPHCWEIA
jgi:hypothetical protein